ncbi:hypothetical protein [uncultured Parasutterella sp.]|nr:hypothetical protein [uncultured Parasutterella sp.]
MKIKRQASASAELGFFSARRSVVTRELLLMSSRDTIRDTI